MPSKKRHKPGFRAKSTRSVRDVGDEDRIFICALCEKGFTRRNTVKDPHFARCVKRNGNPTGLAWDAHPSCWYPGATGPSGTTPCGVTSLNGELEVPVLIIRALVAANLLTPFEHSISPSSNSPILILHYQLPRWRRIKRKIAMGARGLVIQSKRMLSRIPIVDKLYLSLILMLPQLIIATYSSFEVAMG